MIGYVLLIVIAISLAFGVYYYLQNYLPSDRVECGNEVSLSIEEVICQDGEVNVTLLNRGLFNVNGAFIRIGDEVRVFRTTLNEGESQFLFRDMEDGLLNPGEKWEGSYTYSGTGMQEIEVEPLRYIENEPVLCENAVVRQVVDCGNVS